MSRTPAIDCLLDLLGDDLAARRPIPCLSAADWAEFIRLARNFDVAPLLYHRVRRWGPPASLPPNVTQSLQRLCYSSTLTIERLLHQLARVLRACEAHDIPVVALKGVHLAALVYSQPGLRPMTDVDLLIRKPDLPAVAAILSELGYLRDEIYDGEDPAKIFHDPYFRRDGRIRLEVHWHIEEERTPLEVDLDGLWDRARPANIGGANACVLCPEDLLLHLCVHAAYHHYFASNGLRSLCDVAETIRHYGDELDWSQVVRRGQAWRAGRAIYLALLMAASLLRVPVPEAVLDELKPPDFPGRLFSWAEEQLLTDPEAYDGPTSEGWGRIYASPGLSRKLWAVLQAAFPPPAVLARKYAVGSTAPSVCLYYPVHVRDLVRDHAPRACRLWRGDATSRAWAEREGRRIEGEAMRRWMAEGR